MRYGWRPSEFAPAYGRSLPLTEWEGGHGHGHGHGHGYRIFIYLVPRLAGGCWVTDTVTVTKYIF
jgi:hypothetical protein